MGRTSGQSASATLACSTTASLRQNTPNKPPPDAVVLNDKELSEQHPVVLDKYLHSKLRPHQCEGVRWLFRCVMGLSNPGYFGAILADEMGLGKTIQTISLVWTLIKQGIQGKATTRHVVIVTPSS